MKALTTTLIAALGLLAATPAFANLDLAKKDNCLSCHSVDKKIVGPAYRDIAKKYAGDKNAVAMLAQRIKGGTAANGGQKWGVIPMPPNNVSEADAQTLAKWILDGAK